MNPDANDDLWGYLTQNAGLPDWYAEYLVNDGLEFTHDYLLNVAQAAGTPNPNYANDFTGGIPGSVAAEHYKSNGDGGKEISWLQARTSGGQFGRNLLSKDLTADLKQALRSILLENYRMRVGRQTGTLQAAIEQGELTTDDINAQWTFTLADLMRPARGADGPKSTAIYGPIVFGGRGPIFTVPGQNGPMVFHSNGHWNRRHIVGPAAARPIFYLFPHQIVIIDEIIMHGITDGVQAYFDKVSHLDDINPLQQGPAY